MEAGNLNINQQNSRNQGAKKGRNFLLHIHPYRLPEANLRFTHTWGLGGMALTLILLQFFTGILLRFHYEASPQAAYDSILRIQEGLIFGNFVRNIHHWSGMFLIVISFLHLVRVFLSGAFTPPRHWNWVIGVALLLSVVFINFTGYLLPWDQLSYWAITVSTNMLDYVPLAGQWFKELIRGGTEVGASTLLNFYTFHTGIFPALLVVLMLVHFWKVRKAGGVILPRSLAGSEVTRIETNPHLIKREAVVAMALMAFVFIFSTIIDAPLQEKANPAFSPNPAKAPWYFQGIQELILHFHPFFAVVIIPSILLAGLVAIPFLKYSSRDGEVDFTRKSYNRIITWSALTALILTPVLILLDEFVLHLEEIITSVPPFISVGLVPFLVLAGMTWLFVLFIKNKFSNKKIDLVLAIFVLFTVAYLILMFFGTFLRGEGMHLAF
jgi:quinol-cytochrome oxidoreductase complex cytochrome b subunit